MSVCVCVCEGVCVCVWVCVCVCAVRHCIIGIVNNKLAMRIPHGP